MSNAVAKYQKYAEYKDSGIEWLGEIPSHWKVVPCRAVVEHQTEKNTNSTSSNYLSLMANIGVIRYEDKGDIGNKKPEDLSKCKVVKKGQLVINSMNYSIGSFGMSQYDGICSPVYIVLQPISGVYSQRFALRIFENSFFQKYLSTFGNGILEHRAAINWEDIKGKYVPLPSLEEQNHILNFLDHETSKIDSLIAKQEKLIELLKEKRQAVISHAVTKGLNPNVPMKDSGVEWLGQVPEHWQTSCTKYLLEIPITDGPHETPQFVDEGIPFISAEAIHKGKINFDKKRGYIKPELNDIYSKKYSPKLEDIYMVKSGATTGKVAMVETEEKFNIWSPLAVFRCNKIKILPKFLLAVFNSNHFYDALVLNWSYGTQQNIGMGVLSNIEIPCPPINEQQEIIQHIDNELKVFKNLENKANHAIQLMQERRTALISSVVTGKIDVRNWQKPTEAKMEFSA
jgi:type I restriction enzyme S subunit